MAMPEFIREIISSGRMTPEEVEILEDFLETCDDDDWKEYLDLKTKIAEQ